MRAAEELVLPTRPACPAARQQPQPHGRRDLRAAPRVPRASSSKASTARSKGTGYDLVLGAVAPSRDERRAVQSLLDYRCEALVLIGPTLPRAALEELADRAPVVVMARALRSRTVDVVRTDDVAGARLAVEHLVELGHRDIAHVDGQRAPGAAERRRGYRAAMRAAGLGRTPVWFPADSTDEDGEQAAGQLDADGSPTAVTVFNDHCAAGLLAAVRGRGISGAATTCRSSVTTTATSPACPASRSRPSPRTLQCLRASALDLALARAEGTADTTSEVVVAPQLVIRRTTASIA